MLSNPEAFAQVEQMLIDNGTIARFFREVDARYDATHRVFLLNEGKGI